MPELIEYLEDGCSLEAVPHTYGCVKVRDTFTIPNTYGFDFPTDFGSTSAADTYFHAVDDGANTYFFPPAVGQPSTPTLATNVAGIQAFLTSIGSGITYTINAFNEIVLTYANPGDENIWSFWMGTSNSSDSWNNKTTPTLHDLRTDSVLYKSVQVIKLKDSEGNYIDRYFTPSTTGPLKEVNIDTFDTFSFGECPTVVTPTIDYIPHVSGCIKRKNGTVEATCKSTDTTYNFSDTDMVGFTITANDGNGNYTIIQEQSNTIAHNKFLTLLQNVSQPNARILEDVGPGFITVHMWTGNVTNVTSISPLEVQFDFHVEAGVTDTPTPLISPCVDPVPDATYQADAVTLRGIYDPVPLNTQQPNGGTALIFTVTNYSLEYNITGGTEDFIPAKQIVYKDIDGSFVEEYRTVGDINTLIPFNVLTDTFSTDCNNTTSVGMYSALATNASPVTVPANVKSLHILNLGSITNPSVTADISISGGLVETMLAAEESLVYSVQEDGDSFSNGDIIITPTLGYQAKVRWII